MKPFCDIDQYGRKYKYDPENISLLSEMLLDATYLIASELDQAGVDYHQPSHGYKEILMRVTRNVCARALKAELNSDGLVEGTTQATLSANGYSEQFGWTAQGAEGYGGLYLKNSEKRELGIAGGFIGSIGINLSGVNANALR